MIPSQISRHLLGIVVLILADIMLVALTELFQYVFAEEKFQKPYFLTYIKTSMCIIYLSGFIFRPMWCYLCKRQSSDNDVGEMIEPGDFLSSPIYVPIGSARSSESEGYENSCNDSKSVRFNSHSEVRHLSNVHAEDATMARLSYLASLKAEEIKKKMASKIRVPEILKLASIFSFMFFLGNLFYQEANELTQDGAVRILSSTSSFFALIFASFFPTNTGDKFTISKLCCVLLSISGMVLVSLGDFERELKFPTNSFWAIGGAILYAMYAVLLKKKTQSEEVLNLPLFFGFLGLFTALCLWPGLIVLHYTNLETFSFPNKTQILLISIHGGVGTVLSQLMWLWGCFLTTPLVGTLSLSLITPMTLIADVALKNIHYGWRIYVGSSLIFISFLAASILSHYENHDMCFQGLKKCVYFLFRSRPHSERLQHLDREQTESLIENAVDDIERDKCEI